MLLQESCRVAGPPDVRMVRCSPSLAAGNGADFTRPDGVWLVTIFCPPVWHTKQKARLYIGSSAVCLERWKTQPKPSLWDLKVSCTQHCSKCRCRHAASEARQLPGYRLSRHSPAERVPQAQGSADNAQVTPRHPPAPSPSLMESAPVQWFCTGVNREIKLQN